MTEMGGRKRQGSLAVISGTLLAISVIIETCFKFTNAIEASVTADQIALWGSTVTVACTINDLQPLSASEILWYKDSPEEALPGALSQVVGNSTTSRLTLSVVTDEDTGTYYCALPSDGKDVSLYKSSRVVVGKLPAPVTHVECHSRDMLAFWCTWQHGEDSFLDTQYRLQYKGLYSISTWRDCPDYVTKGEDSCHIPALSNSGLEQSINITATNALGSTWKLHRYNPNRSTIPHPPTNVRAEIVSPRQVQAQWDLPMEWQNYMSTYLSYKLRVWEEENPTARADNKWREIPSRQLIRRGRFIQASFHVIQNLKPGSEIRIQAACKYRFSRPRGECWSNWSMPVGVELPALAPSGTVNDLEVSEYPQLDSNDLRRDVVLTWEPVPLDLQNGHIFNYTLFLGSKVEGESNGTLEIFNLPVDVSSFQINDLNLSQEYNIGISACNRAGCGPNATINLESIKQLVPLQPVHLRVLDLANQSLLLTWSIHEFGSFVDHFLLQWTDTPQATVWQELEIPGGELQYLINNPENPATYSFRVQAFNSLEQAGPWSRTLTVHLDGIQLTLV